jgi:hypothetical protein
MALITINDLPHSEELDRRAMRSIVGGGRMGVPIVPIDQALAVSGSLVNYRPGFSRQGLDPAKSQRPEG